MTAHDPVLSPREVAQVLDRHYETVVRLIRRGELPAAKRGGRYYIRRSALEEFLNPDHVPA